MNRLLRRLTDKIDLDPSRLSPPNMVLFPRSETWYLRHLVWIKNFPLLTLVVEHSTFGMNRSRSHMPSIICVDLDGTLVRTDTLIELFLGLVRRAPWATLRCLILLFRSKAQLKQELARRVSLAVELLPYNNELIDYLRCQKTEGRRIVLATASDQRLAQTIANHLGWVDEVMASDGKHNLRGAAKASQLIKRFGVGGFTYAGNDKRDLPVWEAAGSAILVSNSRSLVRLNPSKIEASFPVWSHPLRGFFKAIRIYQWVKNLLVFLPFIATGRDFDLITFGTGATVFLCFCLTASGVYIVNDLIDLEADRAHQRKRSRPFARGSLPLEWGVSLGPVLIVAGLGVGYAVGLPLVGLLLIYICVAVAYSVYLKTKPLVDVFSLSLLYTLRILAGAVVMDIHLSIWFLSFSGFIFLSLAFLKRAVEMSPVHEADSRRLPRRGYNTNERELILGMGVASSFSSSIVLAIYLNSDAARGIYVMPEVLWGLVPLCLFWLCRLSLSARRGEVDDDPIVYAAKDPVSWLVGALSALTYLTALHGVPAW